MAQAEVTQWVGFEDGTAAIMMRMRNLSDDALMTQASVTGIELTIRDLADPDVDVVSPVTLTVASVVFDALQTPTIWTVDSGSGAGYNVRYDTLNAHMPEPHKKYWFGFRFDPVSGEDFTIPVTVVSISVLDG